MWNDLEPVLVALAIGALIGAERERSHRGVPDHFGGVRTFTALALVGALAAMQSAATVAVGLGAVAVITIASAWRSMEAHPGSTTVVAGLATYLLGSMTDRQPQLAVAVAVMLVALLMSKERVHDALRERVTDAEVEDAVKLAVVAFVVLPLLPDRGMGPYNALNPFRIWLLVVAVIGIGWLGYLGVRLLGARRGLLVSGAAGGFVSASATTAAMGRIARGDGSRQGEAMAGALVASVSTMVQLIVVVGVGSPAVAGRLGLPAAAAALALLVGTVVVLRVRRRSDSETPSADAAEPDAPVRAFALRPALVLAAVVTLTVLLSRWAATEFGRRGTIVIAAFAGLADGHAGAISAAELAAGGRISTGTAAWAAAASIGTNTAVKLVIAFVAGGARFGRIFAAIVTPAAAAFAVVLALV